MDRKNLLAAFMVLVIFASGCAGASLRSENSYVGKMVFVGYENGGTDVYIISPDGSGLQNLTNTPDISETSAAISGDGSMIVYQDLMSRNVFLMSSDGSDLRQIIADESVMSRSTSWMPDGVRLEVCSRYFLADGGSSSDAYYYDVTSGEKQSIEECIYGISPDGEKHVRVSENVLNVLSLTGDTQQSYVLGPATDELLYGAGPWSPDEGRIIFVITTRASAQNPRPPMNFSVLDLSDGSITPLTNDGFVRQCPSWSPDGRKIAFTSDLQNGQGHLQIFIMNSDGTDVNLVTDLTANCVKWQQTVP